MNEVEKKCLDILLKAMTFNFSKTRQEITGRRVFTADFDERYRHTLTDEVLKELA